MQQGTAGLPGTAGRKFGVSVGAGTDVQALRVEVHYDNTGLRLNELDPGTGYELELSEDDGSFTQLGVMTLGTVAVDMPSNTGVESELTHFWGEGTVPNEAGPGGVTAVYNFWCVTSGAVARATSL